MPIKKATLDIEYLQHTGDNIEEISDFLHPRGFVRLADDSLEITTITDGKQIIRRNDYLIKGVHGYFFPYQRILID